MAANKSEDTVKKMTRQLVRECALKGDTVSDTLVALMVKAVISDPENRFNISRGFTKQDVRKLKELSLKKLMKKSSPGLNTIKMQEFFDTNYSSRSELLGDVHQSERCSLSSVIAEIMNNPAKTSKDLDDLYSNVITFIMLRFHLGSTVDVCAVRETTAALRRVFPRDEVKSFTLLLKSDKEQQLHEMAFIVSGLRLFHRARDQSEDQAIIQELVPPVLKEALVFCDQNMEEELRVTERCVWECTALLEKMTEAQPGQTDLSISLLRQTLYNVRQHQSFLSMLLDLAHLSSAHVEVVQTQLLSNVKLLKDMLQSKTNVPTAAVYPLFKDLSQLWSELQDEGELLNILGSIMLNLQPFMASPAAAFSEEQLNDLLQGTEVKTDVQRIEESSDEKVDPAEFPEHEWLMPETTASLSELPLHYNGFCGYTLVKREGLLLPGNPHIGILKHKDKLYSFSSKEAALAYASSPDNFEAEVLELVMQVPELVQLLNLQQDFSLISQSFEMEREKRLSRKSIIKKECSAQTDLHPVKANIDKSYEWNEWEHRRKALQLADLQSKVTHSTQTDQSHMRRENTTQTWLPKDSASQTKRDATTSIPKPQIYYSGLRGQSNAQFVKTDLTPSVNE